MLNIAVVSPMPNVSATIATSVSPGLLASERNPWRMSRKMACTGAPVHWEGHEPYDWSRPLFQATLELELLEVAVILPRAREFVPRTFLLDVARLLLHVRNRGEQGAQVHPAGSKFGVVRAVRNDILHVETPVPAAIPLEVLQRFSTAYLHVPEIELQPDA